MSYTLQSVAGIDNAIVGKLKKQSIATPKKFVENTRTPEARRLLSKNTGISIQNISKWAAEFELLRIPSLTIDEAEELVEAGIYSIEQLRETSTSEIFKSIKQVKESRNEKVCLTESKIQQFQKAHISGNTEIMNTSDISTALSYDGTPESINLTTNSTTPSDHNSDNSQSKESVNSYTNLSDVIAELGKGIAEAQKKLDESAIETENMILQNDRLYHAGIRATWYVMPEVEFSLKMDYSVSTEEKTEVNINTNNSTTSSEKPTRRIRSITGINVLPMNATSQTYFRSEKAEQSVLKLRFVPVPAADGITERKYVPDCTGKTVQQITEIMNENNIATYDFYQSGNPDVVIQDPDLKLTVKTQTPRAKAILLVGEKVKLYI